MIKSYGTMLWRAAIYLRRSPVNFFDLIVWPLVLVIPFGLFAKYTASSQTLLMILIIGSIGWVTTGAVQRELALNFMIEVWQRTIKKSRVLPISDFTFVTGNWLVGIVRGIITFGLIAAIAFFLFGLNVFAGDLAVLALIFLGICLSGLIIGMFVISMVKLLGHRADVIAWFMTEIIVVFSGIYYSVTLLPQGLRYIAYASPLTYIFESFRQTLIDGAMLADLYPLLLKMFGLLAFYLVAISLFYRYAEKRAIKTGFYQKYD